MSTPPITIERFTELAHRTASRYSHRSDPSKIAYTFMPHTLEDFHRQVCEVVEADRASRDVPAAVAMEAITRLESITPNTGYAASIMRDAAQKCRAAFAASPQPQPSEAIAYTPGEWFDATTVDLMQAFFESRLPAIREAARRHGYAIGLHGSMRRDLDLIAAPWRDDASEADALAHAVAVAACGITRAGAYEWEQKPAGRVATCIPICWTHRHGVLSDGHIDLSVAPVAQPFLARVQPHEVDRGSIAA